MQNRVMIYLIRISIIFMALVGFYICAFWYPISISLDAIGIVSGESSGSVPITQSQEFAFWTQLIFMWLASVPCFFVLILFFRSTVYARREETFYDGNARIFHIAAWTLFIDSIVFVTGNILFMFLKWNSFAFVYCVIGMLGMVCALACYAAYRYISKAASIQEENDSIL